MDIFLKYQDFCYYRLLAFRIGKDNLYRSPIDTKYSTNLKQEVVNAYNIMLPSLTYRAKSVLRLRSMLLRKAPYNFVEYIHPSLDAFNAYAADRLAPIEQALVCKIGREREHVEAVRYIMLQRKKDIAYFGL